MTDTVKAAISLRKPLFEQIDATARQLKVSRSRLISIALEDYLYRRASMQIQDSWNSAFGSGRDGEDKSLLDAAAGTVHEIAGEW